MKTRTQRWSLATTIAALLFFSQMLGSHYCLAQSEPEHKPGLLSFSATPDIVAFPAGVSCVFFDTVDCPDCRDSLASWKMIGELVIEGITRDGTFESLTQQSQLGGIEIGSSELLGFIKDNDVYAIRRHFPKAIPGDTLIWNKPRKKYVRVPDLSVYYLLRFDPQLDVLQKVSSLDSMNIVDDVSYVPVPQPTGVFELEDPWLPNDTALYKQWYHEEKAFETGTWRHWGVGTKKAWSIGTLGYGATIAICQAGVYFPHPDLDGNLGECGEITWHDDHGTQMAGLACAVGNNREGICGVAPEAQFFPYDNKDNGNAEEDIHQAILDSANVICIAWKDGGDFAPLRAIVETAYSWEIPIVCSAGNLAAPYGPPYRSYPSLYTDWTISVGAHLHDGGFYPSSNHGWEHPNPDSSCHFVDVTAPGSFCYTTATGGGYGYFSATSASAPIVAGVVALAVGYSPDSLTVDQIQSALKATADYSLLAPGDSLSFGAGRVDAYEFMKLVQTSAWEQEEAMDSIPCLIITDYWYVDDWEPLAQKKTREGTPTRVLCTDSINSEYWGEGEDLQARIRACIKDYYDNYHLEYVILGADLGLVPSRFVYNDLYGAGQTFISDYYYACLDGDWDDDGDGIYGEPEDDVDLTPEVAVGRIASEAALDIEFYLEKLEVYNADTTSGWRTRVLGHGSKMFREGDGRRHTQHMLSHFPGSMSITELYDDSTNGTATKEDFIDEFNEGNGIVLLYGAAPNSEKYIIWRADRDHDLTVDDVDTLSNDNMPSVIYGSTCWNHDYDGDCMADHYMHRHDGGAIAYIGSSCNDYVLCSREATEYFFENLFDEGPYEIGKLLNEAKSVLIPKSDRESGYRHTMFSYMLSGDPQMKIWTAEPASMVVDSAPEYVYWGDGPQDFDVYIKSGGSPVEGALVCASQDTTIWGVAYTDTAGVARFEDLIIPDNSSGVLTLVASKHNYFTVEIDTFAEITYFGVPGDADSSGTCNITDAIFLIAWIFSGGPAPPILNRADADGDCHANITDAIYITNYIFDEGPAPVPGCEDEPWGGKLATGDRHPADRESYPAGLSLCEEVSVNVLPIEGRGSLIRLTSDRNIHGLSVTLSAYDDQEIAVSRSLSLPRGMELYWHQTDDLVKIGLIDLEREQHIPAGETDLLWISGAFEIDYVLAAHITEEKETITLLPSFTNADSLVYDVEFDQNYPNPFNPTTNMSFALPARTHVTLEVFNVLGQKVKTLADREFSAGRHVLTWDSTDESGKQVATGVYFSRFQAGDYEAKKKMVIVK